MNILLRMAVVVMFAAVPLQALAQQDPSAGQLICNSDTGACEWQSKPTLPSAFPGQPGADPALVEQPLRWLFAWEQVVPGEVRQSKPPAPQCPASPHQAMDYMQAGAIGKDVNLIISGYDWKGQSSRSSDGLIARMLNWTPGSWQVRRVEGRIGGPADDSLVSRPPRRLRWLSTAGQIQGEFEVVSRMGCSFLRLVPISSDWEDPSLSPEEPSAPSSSIDSADQPEPPASGNVIQILSPPPKL